MILHIGTIQEVDREDWTRQLYPCPFCEGDARIMCNTETEYAFIECKLCGGRSKDVYVGIPGMWDSLARPRNPFDELLTAWNNRPHKL